MRHSSRQTVQDERQSEEGNVHRGLPHKASVSHGPIQPYIPAAFAPSNDSFPQSRGTEETVTVAAVGTLVEAEEEDETEASLPMPYIFSA